MVYPAQTDCRNSGGTNHSHSELWPFYRHLTGSRPQSETGSSMTTSYRPITQQPTGLAPTSQIRAGRGVLFLPSSPLREGVDNRSTAAAYFPFHTGNGNRNPYDVIQMSTEDEQIPSNTENYTISPPVGRSGGLSQFNSSPNQDCAEYAFFA